MGNRISNAFGGRRIAGFATVAVVAMLTLSGCAAESDAPGVARSHQAPTPLPTATVPAPGGGSVKDVVVTPEDQPSDPVLPDPTPLDKPAELNDGIVVAVTEARRVETKAETPGEVAGPAVAVRVKITNGTSSVVDLSTVMVSLTGDDGAFGQPTTSAPAAPFAGTLAAGRAAEGVYVFGLPAQERDDLSIRVEYVAGAPVALFVGEI